MLAQNISNLKVLHMVEKTSLKNLVIHCIFSPYEEAVKAMAVRTSPLSFA